MKTSSDRISTTHVGSLPRPAALRDLLVKKDKGEAHDKAELAPAGPKRRWATSSDASG
jgi:5-methyltetrahydropteroyltriglutamate--homocysteine methyltransferase